jgi:iron(III) transport system permease protein
MMGMHTKTLEVVGLVVVGIILCSFVAYPLAVGIIGSFSSGNQPISFSRYLELVGSGGNSALLAVWNSVLVSVLTVGLGGILGCFLAFVLTQSKSPLLRIISPLAVIPLAMPPLVGVISFMFVFGEGGFLPRVIASLLGMQKSFLFLDGFTAILAVHVYAFHVYFYLFVRTALNDLDASVLEAASALGSSSWRTLRKIILPELRPALVGASSIAFMSSMASFSAPFVFGGGMQFLTTTIYSSKLNGELDLAAAQSVLLMIVSTIFFLILSSSAFKQQGIVASKGVSRRGTLAIGNKGRVLMDLLCALVLLVELLPVLTIVLVSLVKEGTWTWQLFPSEFTPSNYLNLLGDIFAFRPLANSMIMSLLAALMSATVGVTIAVTLTKGLLKRHRFVLDTLLTLPFSIPGTVVAISLIIAFMSPTVVTGGYVLLGTYWIMPLAYFIRSYPLVVRSASSSLERLDDGVIEAGELFGSRPIAIRRVIWPLLLPGLLPGVLLVMVNSLGEFPSSVLLYTISNRPISVEMLSRLRSYDFGASAAYGVVLLVVVLILAALSGKRSEKGNRPIPMS